MTREGRNRRDSLRARTFLGARMFRRLIVFTLSDSLLLLFWIFEHEIVISEEGPRKIALSPGLGFSLDGLADAGRLVPNWIQKERILWFLEKREFENRGRQNGVR